MSKTRGGSFSLWELDDAAFQTDVSESPQYQTLLRYAVAKKNTELPSPILKFDPAAMAAAGEVLNAAAGEHLVCHVVMRVLRELYRYMTVGERESAEFEIFSADFAKAAKPESLNSSQTIENGDGCCRVEHYRFARDEEEEFQGWTRYGWSSFGTAAFTDCPADPDIGESGKEVTFLALPSYYSSQDGCIGRIFPLHQSRSSGAAVESLPAWSTVVGKFLLRRQPELERGAVFFSVGVLGDMVPAPRYEVLAECYGCFVTIKCSAFAGFDCKRRRALEEALAALRPSVQLLMTRTLAGEFLEKLQSQKNDLEKSRLMLSQLAEPLRKLSRALEVVQAEAQEIRAVLYEPLDAIIGVHSHVSRYFEEGRSISNPDKSRSIVAHQPEDYKRKKRMLDAKWVLTHLLATIRGVRSREKTLDRAFDVECRFYRDAIENPQSSYHGLAQKVFMLAELDHVDSDDGVIAALGAIKSRLFTPFKPDEARTPIYADAVISFLPVPPEATPPPAEEAIPAGLNPFATQAHLLRFIGAVSAAAISDGKVLAEMKVVDGGGMELILTDEREWSRAEYLDDLKKILEVERALVVMGGQGIDANWGDHREPFVRLVRRIPFSESEKWTVDHEDSKRLVITVGQLQIRYGDVFKVTKSMEAGK